MRVLKLEWLFYSCLFALPALATNGMRMPGFGPVQSAMGGVGVGATLDGNAVVSNPAGLASLPAQISVGGEYFRPSVSYSAAESPLPAAFAGAVVARPGATIESQRGASPIPSLALVLPIDDNWTAGLGLFGVSGMGVDYPANLYGGATTTSYLQARLAPALALKATSRLSLGIALNLMAAQTSWNAAAGFGGQPHDTSTSWGVGATAGAKLVAADWLTLGAAWETRSYFRDFSYDIAAHTAVNPATFQPQAVPAGTDKLAFDQPMSAAFGIAATPLSDLLVAADVQWIQWSATNGTNKPAFSQNMSAAMPWDMGWHDQWVFKFGAQVAATGRLKLRAGYDYGKMPLDASCAFENIAFPAVSEHHFTAGAGVDFGRWTVNAGATWSPKATISGSNADYPANGGQAIRSYTTSMSQIAIDAGLTYRM